MKLISILKNSIYTYLANGTNLSFIDIGIIICIASILGLYIFMVYKLSLKNAFYSKEFNLILPGVCLVSAFITIILHSQFIVFVGIISTLSLMRFRHALKEPLDLLYLFWSLCTGIFCGCQLYTLVLLLAIFLTALFLLLNELSYYPNMYILTLTSTQNNYDEIYNIIKPYCKLKLLNVAPHQTGKTLYTFSLKTKKEDIFLNELTKIPSITSLSFTSYNGEYRS